MKLDFIKKYNWIIFAVIVAFQIGIIVFWAGQKSNLYWDEYYTLENTHYAGDSTQKGHYIDKDENYETGKWLPISLIKDTLVVQKNDSVLNDSFGSIISKIVGNQNYFTLLNIVETFIFSGQISIWPSIILNSILLIITQVILYQLAKKLTNDKAFPFFVISFYGFSSMCVSMSVFVRFYILATLQTLVFVYFHLLYYQTDKKKIVKRGMYLLLAYAFLYMGYMNAEFVMIYGGFFAIIFAGFLFITKGLKLFFRYAIPIFGGGFIYLFTQTNYLSFFTDYHSFSENSTGALAWVMSEINDFKISDLPHRIKEMTFNFGKYLFGNNILMFIFIFLLIISFVLYVINKKKIEDNKNEKQFDEFIFVIFGSLVIYFAFFTTFRLYEQIRYISYVFPFLSIIVIALTYTIFKNKKYNYVIAIILIVVMALSVNIGAKVDMLYMEDRDDIELIKETGIDSIIVCADYLPTHISYQPAFFMEDDAEFFVYSLSSENDLDYLEKDLRDEMLIISYSVLNNDAVIDLLKDKGYSVNRIGYLYAFKIDKAELIRE